MKHFYQKILFAMLGLALFGAAGAFLLGSSQGASAPILMGVKSLEAPLLILLIGFGLFPFIRPLLRQMLWPANHLPILPLGFSLRLFSGRTRFVGVVCLSLFAAMYHTVKAQTCTGSLLPNGSLENGTFSASTVNDGDGNPITTSVTTFGGSSALLIPNSSNPTEGHPITGFKLNTGYWVDASTNGGTGSKVDNRLLMIQSGTGAGRCIWPGGMGFSYTVGTCYRVGFWAAQFDPTNLNATGSVNFEVENAFGSGVAGGTLANFSIAPSAQNLANLDFQTYSFSLPTSGSTAMTIGGAAYTGTGVVDWKTLNWQYISFDFTPALGDPPLNIYVSTNGSSEGLALDGFCITTCSAAASCALTAAGETLETCNNNGTTADGLDDYITFSLNPTGTGLGASYSVTASGGATVTLAAGGAATGVAYGAATAFRLQNGSAGGTSYTITVTDVSGAPCVVTTTVQQSACSTPPVTCTVSNDFAGNSGGSFTTNVFGTGVDATAPTTSDLPDGTSVSNNVGTARVIRTTSGTDYSSDGDGYFVYIDGDDACLRMFNSPLNPSCMYRVSFDVAAWDADGGTPTNVAVSIDLRNSNTGIYPAIYGSTPIGCAGFNTWYKDIGDAEACSVAAGQSQDAYFVDAGWGDVTNGVAGNLSSGNALSWRRITYTFTATGGADALYISKLGGGNTSGIAIDNICIEECAAVASCALTAAVETLETCNNNGTTADGTDDYITFSLNPTGTGLGASYSVTASGGATVTLAGGGAATGVAYGAATAFRLQTGSADGTSYTITVTDASGAPCVVTTMVQQSACSTPSCTAPTGITFTQSAATCAGINTPSNNGSISLVTASGDTHYGVSTLNAVSYDGPAFASATPTPALPAVIQSNVPNTGGNYIVRIFNGANDCYTDVTVSAPNISCVCPTPPCGGTTAVKN